MPPTLSVDVAHTQVVDHRIPRRSLGLPGKQQGSTPASPQHLSPFPDSEEARRDVRNMGLAWESLMESGLEGADIEAERLLRRAEAQSPDDAVVLAALGYTEQKRGSVERATKLYRRALALDPMLIDAATNLGVIEARSGHVATAVRLWQDVFTRAPGLSGVGMNIVRALCSIQQFDEARSRVLRVLEFNPDMADAKNALKYINRTPASCGP
jgi:tetratricopeptide (TPR) repeat protein